MRHERTPRLKSNTMHLLTSVDVLDPAFDYSNAAWKLSSLWKLLVELNAWQKIDFLNTLIRLHLGEQTAHGCAVSKRLLDIHNVKNN